jgi:hypothetical protein
VKTRAAAVLAVVGGAAGACLAQTAQVWTDAAHTNPVVMHFSLSFAEYSSTTMLPVALSNGVIDPGEAAFIKLTVSTTPVPTFSGTNPSTNVFWNPAVVGGTGSGHLWGVGGMFVDLVGDNGAASAAGTWAAPGGQGSNLRGTIGAWAVGDSTTFGTSAQNGARMANIQAGQFGGNLLSLATTDPVTNIWRGLWTPASFGFGGVTFRVASNSAGVADGSVLLADSTFPGNTIPLGANTGVDFGSINIPMIPGPSGAALMGMGSLVAARRRRDRSLSARSSSDC